MEKVENRDVRPVRLRLPDRLQTQMVVQCPDDLIPEGHQARVIWQVCQSQDLSEFCEPIKAREGRCGRDATSPALLVSLWLYAAVRGVGSARELARLCKESRPFQWLCGGVSVNHHTLSDFRVDHGAALDALFTRILATLVEKGLVKVYRISQDGTRVRACAGASSYRREQRLQKLEDAKQQVEELKKLLEDPEQSAGLSAKKKAARTRAARERQQRIEQAIERLPELKKKQQKLAKKKSKKEKQGLKEPRASTTDAQATVMKMSNGGFNPAVNVQLATDPQSRAIVGVEVSGEGNDHHLAGPMRQQVEQRTGQKVHEHLVDGGYQVKEEIEQAASEGVTMYVPPKPPRKQASGSEFKEQRGEGPALTQWRQRMGSVAGQEVYKQRASTSETVNGDLRTHRGLGPMLVRGLKKARCIALWCALAYNVMHFAAALIA